MNTAITVMTGLICLLTLLQRRKRIFSVSGIFVITWTICLGFSTFGLFEMNKPSITVIILGCVSMIIFTIMAIIKIPIIHTSSLKFSLGNNSKDIVINTALVRNKWIFLANIVAYIILFPYLRRSINILITQGLYFVRNAAFSSDGGLGTTASLTFFQTIISPLFIVTILLVCIDISKKRASMMSVIIAVLDLALYTIMFAGRYMLLQTLLFMLFASYDSGRIRNIYIYIKKQKKVVIIVLFLTSGLIIMSQARSSASIFKSVYTYFCGSFSYLTYLIENKIGTDLVLVGRTQFGFIYNFIYMILSAFLGVEYAGSNFLITQLTQNMVFIGSSTYNSLGTMLHDFIADYGIYGSVLGVIIYAYACNAFERVYRRSDKVFYKALYYYILFTVVNSVLGYSFRAPATLVIIVFIYIFCYRKEDRRNAEKQ